MNKKLLLITGLVLTMGIVLSLAACSKDDKQSQWDMIKERGYLMVGSSLDYPPHEFIDDNGEIAGFEMDLIRELAKRLDLEVRIEDYGFDTLIATLKQGKIDCIISSMRASADRRKEVDWTEVYYKTTHTLIVASDNANFLDNVKEPEDIKDYTVVVSSGSTHETWVMENLIQKGLMKEDQIIRYDKPDFAPLDVAAGRVDCFLTDRLEAEQHIKATDGIRMYLDFEIKPAYNGSRIAVAKYQNELLYNLNAVLLEMLDDGTIDQLKQDWEV